MKSPSTSPARHGHGTPARVPHHHAHHHGTDRHSPASGTHAPAIRPGFSLLRQSLAGRLVLALGVSALIWVAARSVIG